MNSFAQLGVQPAIIAGLDILGFTAPTPIQEQIIPILLQGSGDVVGLAQTGTGKTAAFGIPLAQLVDHSLRRTQALILCPTRELCMQVSRDLASFSAKMTPAIRVVAVYGGAGIEGQIRSLNQGAHIIVATPGRLHDLMRRGAVDISAISSLVLDEADEMLQMGFQDELNAILAETPANKQTLLFSATMPRAVAAIAGRYMKNPVEVTVGDRNAGSESIRHIYYMVHAKDRYQALRRLVDNTPEIYSIIFCRTRLDANEVSSRLIKDGYNADALHGDLSQSQRDSVMQRFRDRSLQLLVATDVAARGIDVSDLSHVIHYNLPDETANYTHRSGRTGRAGKTGISIAIIHMRERFRIREIEERIRRRFEHGQLPSAQEICRNRILHRLDSAKSAPIDRERLAPFRDAIDERLAGVDRNEMILRFISMDLNPFLEYYRDAPNLDVVEKSRNQGRNAGGYSGKSARDREGRGQVRFSRLYINVGQKDGIHPGRLIGQINEAFGHSSIRVGRIEIEDSTSMLEADSRYAGQVADVFSGLTINGKKLAVKLTEAPPSRLGPRKASAHPGKRPVRTGDKPGGFNRSGKKHVK